MVENSFRAKSEVSSTLILDTSTVALLNLSRTLNGRWEKHKIAARRGGQGAREGGVMGRCVGILCRAADSALSLATS